MKLKLEKYRNSNAFKNPLQKVNNAYLQIDHLAKQMENAITKKLKNAKASFSKEVTKLDALSPLKTLSRGFCIVQQKDKVIAKAQNLQQNQEIDLIFQDGKARAKILELGE